jgi:hypothetical protein
MLLYIQKLFQNKLKYAGLLRSIININININMLILILISYADFSFVDKLRFLTKFVLVNKTARNVSYENTSNIIVTHKECKIRPSAL